MEDRTRIIRLEQIRKDFVANVSNELRTPIQLIKGFSETLLEYSAGQAPHRRCEVSEDSPPASSCEEQFNHYIEIIRKNAGTMENLINDLLSLASLEDDNGFRQIKEDMELLLLFTEALSLVEIQAQKKQINVAIDCDPELKAKLYGSYIIQILVNLLDNAIKYSPSSSQVWARAFRNNKELVLEVKDQGIGIPAEHQDRIFERFYRVDKAHSREAGGTGLGLSIVRHLALLHGGRVELESHAGEGSVFRVLIPEGTENRKNDHQL
jgi:two-component system phosphate regulon sensor histidine kinase PhoR